MTGDLSTPLARWAGEFLVSWHAFQGLSLAVLAASWAVFRRYWAVRERSRAVQDPPGPSWGVGEPCKAILGPAIRPLEGLFWGRPSRDLLGLSAGRLGSVMGHFSDPLGPYWGYLKDFLGRPKLAEDRQCDNVEIVEVLKGNC